MRLEFGAKLVEIHDCDTMKAIRVHQTGGPEVLSLEEIPDLRCGPAQVRIQVGAAGINPVETYVRSGSYPKIPPFPYTPGSDASGVIIEAGSDVSEFAVGDRVYTSGSATGTYAEQAVCGPHQVHRLPESISFEEGAGVNIPYATAYRALFQRAHSVPGETVLIHGASGGVGVAATQLARSAGLKVIGTAGTERGRQLVSDQGAHFVIDHEKEGYLDTIPDLTGGRGVDVILEMLANVNLAKDLTALAMGGRVVVIGCRGSIEINPRDAMGRDASILGMVLFNAPEQDLIRIQAALGAGLESGVLKPIVGRKFSLNEAPLAHQAVMEPGAHGKIVLIP